MRDARPSDAPAVEQVRVDGWRVAYGGLIAAEVLAGLTVTDERVAALAAAFAAPAVHAVELVAEHDGVVVGMARLRPYRGADLDPAVTAELTALYVAPGAWSTGTGGRLLEQGFERLPHQLQVLWVLEGNLRAKTFYERRGFRADGGRQTRDLGGPTVEVRYRRPAASPAGCGGASPPGGSPL